MSKIIGVAPNIVELTLLLNIWSPDTTTELVSLLESIQNVKRHGLIGNEESSRRKLPVNKAATDLLTAVSSAMKGPWKKLHTVYRPYSNQYGRQRVAPLPLSDRDPLHSANDAHSVRVPRSRRAQDFAQESWDPAYRDHDEPEAGCGGLDLARCS
ncbi:hypothetical protein BDV98DRAFT_57509 [Pterulicium gracile]|uniref:Uncharacterized protein n=1 Tax=Pterulicium gracile TaxID=1884261 RepID=A0A5C3QK51_9AGAR|nr:hypothetical protein BDV98DRAFT_57509 [Pterula gracilis]